MFEWWKRLRAPRVERKLLAWHALGRPVWSSRDPAAFAREGYARNAIAYRCVRMIAEAAASAPLKVGPADHPLARLIARPNPEQTGVELMEAYFGHQPQDGSGDVFFHLDSLWGDPSIDAIGVDWYPPLSDWRDSASHLDAELARNVHDLDYLASRVESGEDYDWHYASDADRDAQERTAITDGAHDEPWVFRAKDVRNFWARVHYDRLGGIRALSPTAWTPQSKPVWFVELGCPAVDKGANAPNLFIDTKSSESAPPPYSDGARDDLIQRRTLEAYLRHWDEENPISTVTDDPMLERAFVWAWDARPHPAFPARGDVWSDGPSWRLGHWVNGRAGLSMLGEVVADLCARAGADDVDVSRLTGAITGYIVDSPSDARAALEPLMAAFDFSAVERDGQIVFEHRDDQADPIEISLGDLSAVSVGTPFAQRADAAEAPIEARIRFMDPARDYLIGSVSARRLDRAEGGVISVDAPLVIEAESAERVSQAILADRRAAMESLAIEVSPALMALELGDRLTLSGGQAFEIARIEDSEVRGLELTRTRAPLATPVQIGEPNAPQVTPAPTPAVAVLDLPPLPGAESDERPLVALFASPWLGEHQIYAGASVTSRARATQPAIMGELLWELWPGPVDRWDDSNVIRIQLYGGTLSSAEPDTVLNGANVFAIEGDDGEWEVVQARTCELVAPGEYELSGFLRGQLGSSHAMRAPHPVGARIVKLDARLARVDIGAHEWNEPLLFSAPPAGAVASDPRAETLSLTLPHAAARPWAPAHLRAKRGVSGVVAISWVRCARVGGDTWGPGEPSLGAPSEGYVLEILDGSGLLKRSVNVSTPGYLYGAAEQTADFGAPPASLRLRVAQIGENGASGLNKELTITL